MKSVTALEANMPIAWHSSVHVAVDEERPDMMRVLILPDQETPYANGAYVFDMFLPAEFPDKPPLVRCHSNLQIVQ
jgi:ubiquitin-protein ligase